MAVLSLQNISKNYGNIQALKDVSFDVPKGSVFGILGPNGSGKTTLLGIVLDVLKVTSGGYSWNGVAGNNNENRRNIGTLLETPNFYHYLSGEKNLKIAAAIKEKGEEDIENVLKAVNLYQRKDSKFSTYSLGMKQRLAIASTLLGNPDVLVFDEPTNGLDPVGIAEIRQLIKELSSSGKTIIMASHILDEVEKICTHVAIIQKGDLKTVGLVHDVLNTSGDSKVNYLEVELGCENIELLKQVLANNSSVVNIETVGDKLIAQCAENYQTADLNSYCFENNIRLSHLVQRRKSLETRFLEITGKTSSN